MCGIPECRVRSEGAQRQTTAAILLCSLVLAGGRCCKHRERLQHRADAAHRRWWKRPAWSALQGGGPRWLPSSSANAGAPARWPARAWGGGCGPVGELDSGERMETDELAWI